jgi:uncharacterized ParB-like nuclease family protein
MSRYYYAHPFPPCSHHAADPLGFFEIRVRAASFTQVAAVGRICVPTVESGRYHSARGVTPHRDMAPPETTHLEGEDEHAAASRVLAQLREGNVRQASRDELEQLRMQLEQSARSERHQRMHAELCTVSLDAAPDTSLARLHQLWGVESEAAAQQQLLSFAACHRLSAVQRSLALGMTDTAERMRFAKRCQLKEAKRAAAHAAAQEVLLKTMGQ